MRLVFFGSGAFGSPTLKALFASRHKIAAIVTQPDKTGRGHHRHVNPIKQEAEQRTRPLLQPANVNAPDVLKQLADYKADIFVTAAYGQLLKDELLAIPPQGCINLHASLLPKYRGAAPIHAALRAGDSETGISIFRIVRKLDAGPILSVETTSIAPGETTGGLHDRLAQIAAAQTIELLNDFDKGTVTETEQDDAFATYAPQLRKEDGRIDWRQTPVEITNHIRAMTPWPGAHTTLTTQGRSPIRLTVTAAHPSETIPPAVQPPGTLETDPRCLLVHTGGGLVQIDRLKPAGRNEMEGHAFLTGWGGTGVVGDEQ